MTYERPFVQLEVFDFLFPPFLVHDTYMCMYLHLA